MNPKMIWANMAVDNLERTTRFYTTLGFTPNGKPSQDLTSFKVGENAFIIHFFLRERLQPNMYGEITDSTKSNEIIFTLWAETVDEVDQWAAAIEAAGGTIVSPPIIFGDNYYGFVFADPDGHKFNVFHM